MCFKPEQILANEIMSQEFCTIAADKRLLEAKEEFSEYDVDYLLVLEKRRCVGVLQELR